MDNPTYNPELLACLSQLENKFTQDGQSLTCQLEGLVYNKYVNYWDYINQDLLLNLQQPKTSFPDEMVFIVYHQMCELYFKLILWEIEQITLTDSSNPEAFIIKTERIGRYYEQLVTSFSIMTDGMEQSQFSQFRKSLFPASGFQSVQYRLIEISATDLINLVSVNQRNNFDQYTTVPELFSQIYWSKGSIEINTGKKDLSAKIFEEKYASSLLAKATSAKDNNLWQIFNKHFIHSEERDAIVFNLRNIDQLANIDWPMTHYRAAVKHLQKKDQQTGSGGTNWRKYLPPFLQKIIFFPQLWTSSEKENWGLQLKTDGISPKT